MEFHEEPELGIKKAELEILEVDGNGKTAIEVSEDEQISDISKRDFGLTWD